MARFDTLLVSPSSGQLAAQLARATSHANEGMSLLRLDQRHWDDFLERLAGQPEGLRQWSDTARGHTARVAVAWWTDHVGRQHFRIQAGNSADGSYRSLTSSRTDPRPALWHVYPEQVFYRERGEERGWRVVCGCGLCDTPARLGWMGSHCGPCHDRVQEGTDLPQAPPPALRHLEGLNDVVFSPDGRCLALALAGGVSGVVRLCDLHQGAADEIEVPGRPEHLAFSPDGNLLAVSAGVGSRCWLGVLELSSRVWLFEEESDAMVACLAFSPVGEALAVGRPSAVEHWEPFSASWRRSWHLERDVTALAYSPGGDLLAIGGPAGLALFSTLSGQSLSTPDPLPDRHTVFELAFPGRDQLIALIGPTPGGWMVTLADLQMGFQPRERQLRFCEVGPDSLRSRHTYPVPGNVPAMLSPDGRWLACLVAQNQRRPLVALVEATTAQEIGRVGWDLDEPLAYVRLSPDGQTLATVSTHGTVKVLPWKLLLES